MRLLSVLADVVRGICCCQAATEKGACMIRNTMRMVVVAAVVAGMVGMVGCAGGGRARTAHDPYRFIKDHNLGNLPKFDIPIEVNDRVVAWMEYFQGPGRNHFRRYMERSGRYMPLMQEILRKNGMPSDLIYIALIESGFNTQARSSASAVGPWQFISATGRRYGLRIDGFVDERRDPYRSTQAAVQYFRDLYNEFGDWYLAMAGYNAGEGRVRQAIESTGTKNFWNMNDAFRAETRDYVPKFIAAAIMAKMPERFGFEKIDYRQPFDYEVAPVESQTDIPVIAKCAGVSEDDILDLNPHLVGGTTPPSENNFHIRLPRGTARQFREKYAALSKEERLQIVRYEVRRGDTLARVARRYGVSVATLASVNGLSARQRRLPVGMTMTIPRGGMALRPAAVADGDAGRKDRSRGRDRDAGMRAQVHTMKKGETLAQVARRYDVNVKQLLASNGIRDQRRVHAGTRLVVRAARTGGSEAVAVNADAGRDRAAPLAPGQEHKVQKGETLSTISRRYGVTVKQLLALNGLSEAGRLQPGVRLVVRKGKAAPAAISEDKAETPVAGKQAGPAVLPAGQHRMEKGETPATVAAKYGLTPKALMEMNDIRDPTSIRAGTMLVVKAGKIPETTAMRLTERTSPEKAKSPVPIEEAGREVKATAQTSTAAFPDVAKDASGRSEAPAAQAKGSFSDSLVPTSPTTAVDLRERDVQGVAPSPRSAVASIETPKAAPPKASERPSKKPDASAKATAAVPPAGSTGQHYMVKDGDTLWDIARRHKVTIAQIQQWNRLSDPSAVKPGTTITIRRN